MIEGRTGGRSPSLKQEDFDVWVGSSAVFCQALYCGFLEGRGPIWRSA